MTNDLIILHISDLHYDKNDKDNIDIIINSFFKDLKTLEEKYQLKPDCIIFSGDLINKGDDNAYDDVKKIFFEPLLKQLRLNSHDIYIAPGNHDVQRNAINKYYEAGLKSELNNNAESEAYVEKILNKKEKVDRLNNFNQFKSNIPNYTTINDLYSTHIIQKNNCKIGIACINSAWRAFGGDGDYGELLISRKQVESALKDLESCDLKIAAFHHNWDYLKEFERMPVKRLILSKFNLVLLGHIHDVDCEMTMNPDNNVLINKCSSLYQGRNRFNGYAVIRMDLKSKNGDIFLRRYYEERGSFDENVHICPNGKMPFSLKRAIYKEESSLALNDKISTDEIRHQLNNNLLPSLYDSQAPKDLKLLFVEPPLSRSSEYEYKANPSIEKANADFLNLKDLLASATNLMFIGNKESGKSTLLDYICLSFLESDYLTNVKIPFLIDCSVFPKGANPVKKAMHNFLFQYKKAMDIDKELSSGNCILLLDNLDALRDKFYLIKDFILKYPNNRYIFATNENLLSYIYKDNIEIGIEYEKIYLHSFKRKHTRKLISKWFPNEARNIDNLLDKVLYQIKSINLPCTPMIISVCLWIIEKQKRFTPINKATLIEKFVEFLLEKTSLENIKSEEIDFKIKEDFLMSIAAKMVEKNEYAFEVQEFEKETLDYFEKMGLRTSISNFIGNLIERGIFYQSDGKIIFKFKCFCEFFVAKHMIEDAAFLKRIIDEQNYLSFVNEIDFMTGLHRKNPDLLKEINNRLIKSFSQMKESDKLDLALFETIKVNSSVFDKIDKDEALTAIQSSSISEDEKDQMLEDNYVYPKSQEITKYNISKADEIAISNLLLFSNVIKNSELIKDTTLKRDMLRNCILYYAKLILYAILISEENISKSKDLNDKQREEADHFIKMILPAIIQFIIQDQLGSKKLEVIIKDEIGNKANHIFMRFILVVLYSDLQLSNYLQEIKNFIPIINKNKYLLEVMFNNLLKYYFLHKLNADEKNQIENIISDLFLYTHSTGTKRVDIYRRDNFMSEIKVKKIKIDSQQDQLF